MRVEGGEELLLQREVFGSAFLDVGGGVQRGGKIRLKVDAGDDRVDRLGREPGGLQVRQAVADGRGGGLEPRESGS